jgi:hypothetical protein
MRDILLANLQVMRPRLLRCARNDIRRMAMSLRGAQRRSNLSRSGAELAKYHTEVYLAVTRTQAAVTLE